MSLLLYISVSCVLGRHETHAVGYLYLMYFVLSTQVGGVLGALVSAGVLHLKEVATATLKAAVEGEGEDGQLVDCGSAWKLVGAVLQAVSQNSNQAQMSKQWKDTGVQLDAFFPSVREQAWL